MESTVAGKNFKVSARALLHLGAELITSDEIALYELIKNAFDAKSQSVHIRIVAPVPVDELKALSSNLSSSWGNKAKSKAIAAIKSSIRDEVSTDTLKELDSKISQLYCIESLDQFLQVMHSINYIEVEDDGHGIPNNRIEDVFLMIGTNFKVNNKSDSDQAYLGNKGIGRLSMMRLGEKAEVTSWTQNESKAWRISFDWSDFDRGEKLIQEVKFPMETIDKPTRSSGVKIKITRLNSDWTIDSLKEGIVNKFLRRLQNPFATDARRFPVHINYNGGRRIPIPPIKKELLELADRELLLTFNSKKSGSHDPILVTRIKRPSVNGSEEIFHCSEKNILNKLDISSRLLKEIGPFVLKIMWFNRAKLTKKGLGSDLSNYREELNNWSGGIAIYRDGFRVGLTGSDSDGDWLGLDSKALRGQGFTVNRIQVVGALEIGIHSNPKLTDRSNREGLIESNISKALRDILIEFGANLLKSQIQAENEKEKAERLAELIDEGTGGIQQRLDLARRNINDIKAHSSPHVKKQVAELESNLQFVSNHVVKFSKAVSELQENREDILELAGVGTVMHSILHELARTTAQTRGLLTQIAKKADEDTKHLLEKLEDEIKSINIRLRQLDPLSTSGRQRKQKFDLVKLTSTIIHGYRSRFERHNIDFIFTVDDDEPKGEVSVNMVRGFYSLALENLLTNSIYWLKVGPLINGDSKGLIQIDLDSKSKTLAFSDNGPGISPSDKERIFNPGFSLRKKGNGYGLYIVREVAEHHNAKIYLEVSGQADQRLRTFMLELPRD